MDDPRRDEVPPPPARSKRQWRRSIIAAITAIDLEERRAQESSIVATVPRLPGWADARTVLLYVSAFAEEIDMAPLLAMAYAAGKRVVLPRVDPAERRLRLHAVADPSCDLSPGVLRIPEPRAGLPEILPDAIDWALVPGVAFDERGYRLGRGAGHYDRLLPRMRPDCPCWAVALGCQIVTGLPIEPHDVPVDGVVAPDRMIRGLGRSASHCPPDAPSSRT